VEGEAVIRRIIAVRRTLDGRAHLTPNEIAQIERDVSAEREFADETEIARGLGISASELTGCRGECCYDIRTADGREARLAYVLLRGDPRVNRARLDEVVDQLNPLPTGAEEAESVIGSTTCSMRSTPVGIDRATGTISYETVEGGVVVRRTMEVRRRGEQFFLGSEDAARYRTDMNVERNWFNEWRTATRLGIRQEELARYRNGREYVVPSLANGDVRIPFLLVDGKPRFDSAQLDEYKARIMALPAGAERLTDVTRRIGMVQTNGISGGRTTRQLEYDAIEGERVVRHRVKLFPLDEIDYIAPDGIAQIQADKNAEAGWFTTSETARRLGIGLTDLMWYKSKNEQCYMIPIKGGKKVRFPYITYQGATRIRLGDQQLKVKDDGPD
jgi:hypothetical protein